MSKIILNKDMGNEREVDGAFSFEANIVETEHGNFFYISGFLSVDRPYIPIKIKRITNERYDLQNVKMTGESFGSEDDTITYMFEAEAYQVY